MSPPPVVLLDSSSDESDFESRKTATTTQTKKNLVATKTMSAAPKAKASKTKIVKGWSSDEDSDDEDEELEVTPPTKRLKIATNTALSPSNFRPRLSSTGSNKSDPVDLLVGSPSDQPCAQTPPKARSTSTARPKPVKGQQLKAPAVSMSVASSSASSVSSNEDLLRNKENNKNNNKPLKSSKIAKAKPAPLRAFGADDESDSDSDASWLANFTKSVPISRKKTQPQSASSGKNEPARMLSRPKPSATVDLLSDDDDDDEILSKKPKAQPKPTTIRSKNATANGEKRPLAQKVIGGDDTANDKPARRTKNPYSAEAREAAKAEKQRQREAAQAAKKREKELAKERREQQREERKAAEEIAKHQKKRAKERAACARGKFANKELAVLIEPALLNHATFGVKDLFQEQEYEAYPYQSALSCMAVHWVRRDYLMGGADEAVKLLHSRKLEEVEQLNHLAVVFDSPHDFIALIQQDELNPDQSFQEEDDDYPKLEDWLLRLVHGWRAAWKKTEADRPRIYLLLYGVQDALDKAWVNYNRSRGGGNHPPPPNGEQLHDAILWMLIQFQIEVIHCESKDDVAKELTKMTRFMANARYQKQTTEIACVQKIKSQVSDMAPSYDRATDCWIRQVRQVPRVSHEMATCFCRHYPTARSLWLEYQNPELSIDEKQVMLANCFGSRNSQIKLSKWFYRIFSSQDPEELLT